MISNLFKGVLLIFFGIISDIHSAPENEVADSLDNAVIELSKMEVANNIDAIPPVATKHLKGFTDAERIRGIAIWLNRLDPAARIHGPAAMGRLLINDPQMITDSSELRKMLATENDPSRFFLLSCFSSYFSQRGETFIVEESRMLFRHGRVAPQTNQSTYSSALFDVSAFTYEKIVGTLRALNTSYHESERLPEGGQIPYSEKIPFLVSWLKENWPGCENLAIQDESKMESKKHLNGSHLAASLPKIPPEKPNTRERESESIVRTPWFWIATPILFIAALFGLIRMRKC
jgi:hypothetical protein